MLLCVTTDLHKIDVEYCKKAQPRYAFVMTVTTVLTLVAIAATDPVLLAAPVSNLVLNYLIYDPILLTVEYSALKEKALLKRKAKRAIGGKLVEELEENREAISNKMKL